MPPIEENATLVGVDINGTNGTVTKGELRQFKLASAEKLRRAGRWLAIFWGLALIGVFIPIIHFVFVPLMIFTGIGTATYIALLGGRIAAEQLECPECQKPFQLPEMKEVWPVNFSCPHCGRYVWITRFEN